jgi:hypothetical protein
VLIKVFAFKKDKVSGHWRIFYIKKILDSHISHSIIRVVKSIRLPWHEYGSLKAGKKCMWVSDVETC